MLLRRACGSDRDALYEICVRTAESGGDARGLYCDDDLVPDIYAGPYLELEPDLAFVVDDGGRAVGYVLGARDTPAFAAAFRERWLPRVAGRHPEPPSAPSTPAEAMLASLHDPERMVRPELAPYPAHLHVDLLPQAQGQGWGRVLIRTLLAELRGHGIAAAHLTHAPENVNAAAFYARLGFREVPRLPYSLWIPTDARL
ncbi:GNAT family N-acetyltransferase [Actinotalea sp.]|uniref:GNAT family N-acetyltransferase n=1 Tax=Actinotalea sp. TaxID=1872145 RepID=UPI00356ADDE0